MIMPKPPKKRYRTEVVINGKSSIRNESEAKAVSDIMREYGSRVVTINGSEHNGIPSISAVIKDG